MFSRQPLLFWAAFLAAGCAAGYALRAWAPALWVSLGLLAFFAAAAVMLHIYRRGGAAAVCSFAAAAAAGMLAVSLALPGWYGVWGENRSVRWVSGVVKARRHGAENDTLVLKDLKVMDETGIHPLEGGLALTVAAWDEEMPAAEEGAEGVVTDGRSIYVGDTVTVMETKLRMPLQPNLRGLFDQRLYWAAQGVRFTAWAGAESVRVVPGHGFFRLLDRMRLALYSRMQRDMGAEGADLAGALLLGWSGGMNDQRDAFAGLGISHVLAVSGLHVSLLIAAAEMLGRRLRWMRMQRYLARGVLILLYFLLAGARASFNRVLLSALFAFAAEELGRENDPVNTLAAAFLVQVLLSPLSVFTSSCQLTYLACLALLLLRDRVPKTFALGTACLAMLIAWVVLPFAGDQQYPLASGAANALLVPAFSVMVGASFLYLLTLPVSAVSAFYGAQFGQITVGLKRMIGFIGARVPVLHIPFNALWGWAAASSVLVLLSSKRLFGRRKWVSAACLALAAACLAIAVFTVPSQTEAVVLGGASGTAVRLTRGDTTVLVAADDLYGASEAAESSRSGHVDTLVFTGTSLSALDSLLTHVGAVDEVILPRSYADVLAGWAEKTAARHGAKLNMAEAEHPCLLAGFTVTLRAGGGAEIRKDGWRLLYGGDAEAGAAYAAADYKGLRQDAGAEPFLFCVTCADEEPETENAYNIGCGGVWVRRWAE